MTEILDNDMQVMSIWYEWLPEWFSGIGTLMTVIVALFWNQITSWLRRPKISITCSKECKQCKEVVPSKTASSGPDEIRIRVKILNRGKLSASDVSIYVDSYYKVRSDGELLETQLTPLILQDYSSSSINTILPNLNYYVDVISIRRLDEMSGNGDKAKTGQLYKAAIVGETIKYIGQGHFIIPIKLYASNIENKVAYIKILWDSDRFSEDSSVLDYTILSEKEFHNYKIVNK